MPAAVASFPGRLASELGIAGAGSVDAEPAGRGPAAVRPAAAAVDWFVMAALRSAQPLSAAVVVVACSCGPAPPSAVLAGVGVPRGPRCEPPSLVVSRGFLRPWAAWGVANTTVRFAAWPARPAAPPWRPPRPPPPLPLGSSMRPSCRGRHRPARVEGGSLHPRRSLPAVLPCRPGFHLVAFSCRSHPLVCQTCPAG